MKLIKVNRQNQNELDQLSRENATVMVFHPQCIHCLMMRQAWEETMKKIKGKNNCNVYEVNGEDLDEVQNESVTSNVRGFPTIMNMKKGNLMNYFEKERNVQNMTNFILSNIEHRQKPKNNTRRVHFDLSNNGKLRKTRTLFNALPNSFNVSKKRLAKKNKKQKTNKKANNKKPNKKVKNNKRKTKKQQK